MNSTIPFTIVKTPYREIRCYETGDKNIDQDTVASFGREWKRFHSFEEVDLKKFGKSYFDIVTFEMLNSTMLVADFGCGSGRWTKFIQSRAKKIIAIDPSEAIFYADKLLGDAENIELCKASVSDLPFPDDYFDFGFSLGVLHHIPDTAKAMQDCVRKVKPGGYFLVYLYYKLDNRGVLYKSLFFLSNLIRNVISKFPQRLKIFSCDVLAVLLYMPFVLFSRFLRWMKVPQKIRSKIPLYGYEPVSFYVIRNDSLDRFGTPLEQRFSKKQIWDMMTEAGLTEIIFSDRLPYWHAVGRKKI